MNEEVWKRIAIGLRVKQITEGKLPLLDDDWDPVIEPSVEKFKRLIVKERGSNVDQSS